MTTSYICILKEYREFIKMDLDLANTLSQTVSLQMQRDNLFVNTSGLQEEYYLMDLIMNRIHNLSYIKERLKNIDFKLNKNILLISIPFYQTYKNYRHNFGLNRLINTAKNIFGNCISAYYEEKIILMISKDDEEVFSEKCKRKFYRVFKT